MFIKNRRDWPTTLLWLATAASLGIAFFILWGAGLFRLEGRFLYLSELENVGSFLSGVFTPLAIFWAARTFVLQRQQMVDTLLAMQAQLELQRESIDAQKAQIDRERQHALEASDPVLQLVGAGGMHSQTSVFKFSIANHRATAQRLTAVGKFTEIKTGHSVILNYSRPQPLAQDQVWEISVELPRHDNDLSGQGFSAQLVVLAERLDGMVSEFVFEAPNAFQFAQASRRIAVPGLTLS